MGEKGLKGLSGDPGAFLDWPGLIVPSWSDPYWGVLGEEIPSMKPFYHAV